MQGHVSDLNVPDQSKSFRRRPAVEKLLCPVKFKTIPEPGSVDAWHQLRNTSRVSRDVLAILFRLFDHVPVQIFASDFDHRTLPKDAYKIRNYDFGVPSPYGQ